MADYTRPQEGFRFRFKGVKLNDTPDALPPDKFPLAVNVRGYRDSAIVTRPGQSLRFATSGNPIIDISSYTQLETDNAPRYLACDSLFKLWLDTGAQVGSMMVGDMEALPAGLGVTLLPFRPNQSPTPYMYVANGNAYQKFSAPSATNVVTQSNVGIREPQSPPEACVESQFQTFVNTANFSSWANAGTAGAASQGARVTDTILAQLDDPAGSTSSLQVGTAASYQRGMDVIIGFTHYQVLDVFPEQTSPVGLAAIYYFSGVTGRCVVVPTGLSPSGTEGQSIYAQAFLTGLRRGCIVQIGSEKCFVLSSTTGPDGTLSFETSTTLTHTTAETMTILPAISVFSIFGSTGLPVTSPDLSWQVTAGIGTLTNSPGINPFIFSNFSFQPDDYIHISINVDNLLNLTQIMIQFDVGDGSFTGNYYYYTISPSVIAAATNQTQTMLAAAQVAAQNVEIEALDAIAGAQIINPGTQTSPGTAQWAEIYFPITSLVRVGNDQTKTLQNTNAVQILVNASGTVNLLANSLIVSGGFQADVGDAGAPYLYRVRPRSSVTGVVGNPSPATRYGISPRRQQVMLSLPSAAYDPQIDTWDVFRYGGSVTSFRYIGSTPSTNTTFVDNYSDNAANGGDALEFDNFEPWPTVDVPNNGTASIVAGTIAVVTSLDNDILRYLPGTLVQIAGQNVFTLNRRPTLISGTSYLLQFDESAGAATSVSFQINEPSLANQHMPYLFGPDSSGTVFAVGNIYAAGSMFFSKPNSPDSAPDSFNQEICAPTEPLLGGEVLDGLAFVGSSERWWALYPQLSNPAQRYSAIQQPFPRGLAAPFGHCSDGRAIYWWAKDGIWSSTQGSLTDADLYNLFPHEGIVGRPQTYGGFTYQPPDYSRTGTFRLTYANYFLYATYQDSSGAYHILVCDLREGRIAWSEDVYTPVVSSWYHPPQPSGTLNSTTKRYDEVVQGTIDGRVAVQTDLSNDIGGPIPVQLATFEFDGGDVRASEQWGDFWVDSLPAAASVSAQPMTLGSPSSPAQTIPTSTTRTQNPLSLGGEILADFLGIQFTWTDDYVTQTKATTLYIWQPSFIHKPETIDDRFTDWDDAGSKGAKWFQGFILHADTQNAVKGLTVRDTDTLTTHAFTPIVQQNGESAVAYSFNTPFIAHMVRIEPTDELPWRFFDVVWVTEPTPEIAETWQTQFSTHGMTGYMHLRQLSLTYAATSPVTFAVSAYDGTSPSPVMLPSTGGAVQKIVFPFTFNKGQLYAFKATSATPFQVYEQLSEVLVGHWGRQSGYSNVPLVGGDHGDNARV